MHPCLLRRIALRLSPIICLVFLLGLSTLSRAANIQLSNTRLTLTPDAAIGAIVVHNNDTAPVLLQAEVVAWSQQAGADQFRETRDILVNPVVFRLPAKGDQILRLGLQSGAVATERSYRLFLQEVPENNTTAPGQVRTVLRLSLPIFVPPKDNADLPSRTAVLDWQLGVDRNGQGSLHLSNRGASHIQITNVKLTANGSKVVFSRAMSVYALAGQDVRIPITASGLRPGQAVTLSAQTDGEQPLKDITLNVTDDRGIMP